MLFFKLSKTKIHYICLLFVVFSSISLSKGYSQKLNLSDQTKISLLTNSPWDQEVYALFGHTAIRINDPINELDVVYNYGLFDFDSPNFMLRFIKGETDYIIGAAYFEDYLYEYKLRGVGITEQVLNLNQDETQKIYDALENNLLPENRMYRYNYFYDNCSTRPRDIISKNLNNNILYLPTNKEQTYRNLIHQQVSNTLWVKFGIDLVIGSGADKVITDREKDFLPVYLEHSFATAKIKYANDSIQSLVAKTNIISENKNIDIIPENHAFKGPLAIGCVLLLISIIVSIFSYKKNKIIGRLFDSLLFFIAGCCGCIIFFLMYFSVHPCTNPNWNILWLNPLQLIFAVLFWINSLTKCSIFYHFINFAVLTIFLLAWFLIAQSLEIAFIPFILSLWLRSGMNILQYKKTIKTKKQLANR